MGAGAHKAYHPGGSFLKKYDSLEKSRLNREKTIETKRCSGPKLQVGTPAVVGKPSNEVDELLEELNRLYHGHLADARYMRGDRIKAEQEVSAVTGFGYQAHYGELMPQGLLGLLDAVKARPGQRFYDLGSGTGKTVMLAWLLGLTATGVELVKDRYDGARRTLNAALKERDEDTDAVGARFIHADIASIDFSDADIVFANSVFYTEDLLQTIAFRAQKMRPGSHIITIEGLIGDHLSASEKVRLHTSWTDDGTLFSVQTVEAPSRQCNLS